MKRRRPASVLTLGILHLVGGGLGLIVVFCAGLGLVMQASAASGALGPPAQQDVGMRLRLAVMQAVPSFQPVEIGDVLLRLLLALMLLAFGAGLLMMQPWARWGSLVYAGLSVVEKLFLLGYQLFVVWPVADAWVQREALSQPAGFAFGAKLGFFGNTFFQAAFIIYPLVVVVILLLPAVGRAFSEPARDERRRRGRDEDWEEREDEGWRRRDRDERLTDRWGERYDEDDRRRERDRR
jgi:hypothetical protein